MKSEVNGRISKLAYANLNAALGDCYVHIPLAPLSCDASHIYDLGDRF